VRLQNWCDQDSTLTFPFLVLDLPSTEVFPFLQGYDLRRLVVPVLTFAPRIVSRAFWDGRLTGYGWSPRTIFV
jgi:hypothetical protein